MNRPLQCVLKEHGIHHLSTHSEEPKASNVERFNRILKTRIWRYFTKNQTLRYIDALPAFVRSYNNTYHRSIGMASSKGNAVNQVVVWQRLHGVEGGGGKLKLRVDDRVRISNAKRLFKKGYMANWSDEFFTIRDTHPSDPSVYPFNQRPVRAAIWNFFRPGNAESVESSCQWYSEGRVLVCTTGYLGCVKSCQFSVASLATLRH